MLEMKSILSIENQEEERDLSFTTKGGMLSSVLFVYF